MNFPFTSEQFMQVFVAYNNSVWPFQYALFILALILVYLASKRKDYSKFIIFALSFYWLWMGLMYHYQFFSQINKMAYLFGLLFFIQGLLIIYYGIKKKFKFIVNRDIYGVTGSVLIIYSLFVYPLLGYNLGHLYPASPTFGLPCPTTIFTLGFILWIDKKVPYTLLIIPFLWSILGFSAAFSFGIWEDTGLIIAGITTYALILLRNNKILHRHLIQNTI